MLLQVAGTLDMSSGLNITLAGGAQTKIFSGKLQEIYPWDYQPF